MSQYLNLVAKLERMKENKRARSYTVEDFMFVAGEAAAAIRTLELERVRARDSLVSMDKLVSRALTEKM